MSQAYSTRYDEALVFTAQQFRGKFRKGRRIPYLTHLLAVAAMVGEGGGDEDQQIAALLHDWLEDIPGASPGELRHRFGDRVCELVVACSDCMGSPKPPWRERKERYIAHLYESEPDVKLISVADKLHNCSSTLVDLRARGPVVFDRFNAPKEGVLWYYRELVPALESNGWEHYLLDAFRAEVDVLLRFS